ncbi:MAG: NAD(P)H-dependent oxidoreductase [Clostridia bacterium]|nr:NAD(P)H-dependent oxidoreductase [Clostridia bacterium]
MKVTVINGSPKGDYSITVHTVKYMEKHNPDIEFTYINAGAKIKYYEKHMSEVIPALISADLILFSYPVYTFLVPCQLHRFIELLKEHNVSLKDKFVSQISTSKHFYDVTAHNFIKENCFDLEMKYVKGLSADMDDLKTEKGRKDALNFMDYLKWCMENDIYEEFPPISEKTEPVSTTVPSPACSDKKGDIVIVADLKEDDISLQNMIKRFEAKSKRNTRVVNIHDFPFKGGCISCFNCATDGKCIYMDGFDTLLRDSIQKAEAIVIAFSIRDHSMGSIFKTYDDRQFCNGHRTVTMGMGFGYFVSGNYSKEKNLQMVIEGRAEVGNNFLCGVATDEFNPDEEIDTLLKRMEYAIEKGYVQPSNFLGVGGMKIFRDLIWGMQGLMKADHRFYKSHGQYDFPQKKRGLMYASYLIGAMMGNRKLMEKAGGKVKEGMIMPYKKVLEKY